MRTRENPWAWLSCALVLEKFHNGVGVWHQNPFFPEERLQVVSDLFDVWFWVEPGRDSLIRR